MARYHIMVRECGSDHETLLAQCDSNPMAIVEAARNKQFKHRFGGRTLLVARYEHVHAVDTQTGEDLK